MLSDIMDPSAKQVWCMDTGLTIRYLPHVIKNNEIIKD